MIGYLRDYADKLENIGDQPELSRILSELITSSSRGATKVVAASDSLESSKQAADYICTDTNFETQMALAIGTGGRKIILLDGNYIKSTTTAINIYSNIELEIIGTIKFADSLNDDAQIFVNADASNGNSHIHIHGSGILDGNRANNSSGEQTAIKFTKVAKSIIDISMKNFRSYNVQEVSPDTGNKIINREYPNVAVCKNIVSKLEAHPLWEPLDDFETDWIASEGTITYDTTIKHRGTRSVKIITLEGGKGEIDKVVTKDMSSKGFSIWFYTEDASKIDTIKLTLRSGGNWAQYRVYFLRSAFATHQVINEKWICLNTLSVSTAGNFDIKNVDRIRITVMAKSGEIATVWFDDFRYATQSIAKHGMITVMFDDGYESDYTKAKQYLDKYNYPGCSAVITNTIGTSGRLTKTQLEELQDCGWDIVNHSLTHAYTKDGINIEDSYAIIEEESLGAQDWLIQNGFSKGAKFYIFPGGRHSKKFIDIIEKYFVGARLAEDVSCIGTPLPVPDPRVMCSQAVIASSTPATIKAFIDKAYDQKYWLILYFHEIVDSGATEYQYNKSDFEEIINYINTKNMPVATFSQVFDDILFAPKQTIQYSDLFMDVLAVSATHVRSNEDLSAATPITFTIDAQPDVPRTLSGHFDSHAQITEYDIEIIGVDAKGNTVTETKDESDGWDWETSNAFATITSIKMTSRTGTGAADTMDIGITDVLGLSNAIYATSDVFKIKKNNANANVAGADVNVTYDTYDMHTITLGATDDFTIWYKSNLNIIS